MRRLWGGLVWVIGGAQVFGAAMGRADVLEVTDLCQQVYFAVQDYSIFTWATVNVCLFYLFVDGAAAWLECSVEEELPGGDHVVVLLRVHGHRVLEPGPLVFHASTFSTVSALKSHELSAAASTAVGGGPASSHSASSQASFSSSDRSSYRMP